MPADHCCGAGENDHVTDDVEGCPPNNQHADITDTKHWRPTSHPNGDAARGAWCEGPNGTSQVIRHLD